MSDVYRGRTVIKVTRYWYEAFIAPGFFTLGTSWEPNAHFELFPDVALVNGFESYRPHNPRASRYLLIGAQVRDDQVSRCKSVRIGRVACLRGRDVVSLDTTDLDAFAGACCDYDDFGEQVLEARSSGWR